MTKSKKKGPRTLSGSDVEEFERLQAQIEGLHAEIQTLVKKSPHDLLNKFKLRLVNTVIRRANGLLSTEYRPFSDFDDFPEDPAPSNSDVLLILNQYLAALETMRTDHISQKVGPIWVWKIDGEPSTIRTPPPRKLDKK